MILQQALEHFHNRRLDQAEILCRRYLQDDPRQKEACWLLANVLARQSRNDQAVYFAEIAAKASPHNVDRGLLYVTLLNNSKNRDLALVEAESLAARFPQHAKVLDQLATAYRKSTRIADAIDINRKIIKIAPTGNVLVAAGCDIASHGLHEEGEKIIDQGLALDPADPRLPANPCFCANAWSHISARQLFERHLEITRRFKRVGSLEFPPLTNKPDPERQIHLGYMTGDAKSHSVSYFLDALLRYPDRRKFKIHLYANVRKGDDVTKRFVEMADVHRVLTGLDETQAVEQMRRDKIDILVDLSGLTSGSGVWLMRNRAAPIQATYLGYCNTSAVPGVDVRLVDAITDPISADPHAPDAADALATERLVRIDGCFICYRPPDKLPPVEWKPTPGRVTFGCFNAIHKISQACYDLWAKILIACPEGVLLLKNKPVGDPKIAAWVRNELVRRGARPEQVEFLGRTEKGEDHLSLYNKMDVALDPFPYNGTTTSCETFFMATPMISLRGDRHCARVGASLLTAIGCPELVAENPREYSEKAVTLGRDAARLARYRAALREQTRTSMLCNGKDFMKRLESVYALLWWEWCQAHGGSEQGKSSPA